MMEIQSPFRKPIQLNMDQQYSAKSSPKKQSAWVINPVKIPRNNHSKERESEDPSPYQDPGSEMQSST